MKAKFPLSLNSFRNVGIPHLLIDLVCLTLSLYLSLWLRLGSNQIHIHLDALHRLLPFLLLTKFFVFLSFGVYRILWRYISAGDALLLAQANFATLPFILSTSYILKDWALIPRATIFIDSFVSLVLLMGVRVLRRKLYEDKMKTSRVKEGAHRLLIYGAGKSGQSLIQRLSAVPISNPVEILGFIDDDAEKQGKWIHGYPVLGTLQEIESLIVGTRASQLIVAISHLCPKKLREIVITTQKYSLVPQILDDLSLSGKNSVSGLRHVELRDLLNRRPASIGFPNIQEWIKDKCVLITGAGGSIGSELARQVAKNNPSRLLLLDHSEYCLYNIDKELRPSAAELDRIVPLLIDVKDRESLKLAFERLRPDIVIHAAAYKHVHLVEANPLSSILNNILGTKNLIDLCVELGVGDFVLISSDKAVNPAGVMGATKRVCELLTSAAAESSGRKFSSVRFGNVLGSSGSLIPLIKMQIEKGGPVTLTHPDVTRYFMLIPEAVNLVLMSGSIANPGDVHVLKMGEPVKITDIARALMALMGRAESEIPVVFTGLRPGEKMYEELYLSGNERSTVHPDILVSPLGDLEDEQCAQKRILELRVSELIDYAKKGDLRALTHLMNIVKPSSTARFQGESFNWIIDLNQRRGIH